MAFFLKNIGPKQNDIARSELPSKRYRGSIKEIGPELDINEEIKLDYTSFLDAFEHNFSHLGLRPHLLFETSRGCWWGECSHCTFCGLNGMTMSYRAMQPETAIKQFHSLFKYAGRCISLECVDNILPTNYLKDVLPFLNTPSQIYIFYEVKANLRECDIQALAQAGVKTIQPGIEALATPTLHLMKKGTSAFQNISLLRYCVMYDVYPVWNLLMGFPGEDEEVYKKYIHDLPLLTHLPPPSGAFLVRFDRYSPYFMNKNLFGLDLHPAAFYTFIYPFEEDSLEQLAYYFVDHNYTAPYKMNAAKWFGKIQKLCNTWRSLWFSREQNSPPKLFVKGRQGYYTIIHDSRSGQVIERHLTEIGKLILEHLEKPGRISDLSSKFTYLTHVNLEKEIALLQEQGLIFQEGDRLLSLVFPYAPSPMQSFKRIQQLIGLASKNSEIRNAP